MFDVDESVEKLLAPHMINDIVSNELDGKVIRMCLLVMIIQIIVE